MLRIAVVEDDPVYQKQLKEYLARYEKESGQKIKISLFTDGDEIALGYRAEYDIILMDIEMKYMDGMTAAQEIRHHDPQVVIIFITNSPQYAIRGYAVDALDYVLKPISYYAFSQRIDRAVSRLQNRSKKYLYLSSREGSKKLDCSRLLFLEVQGHDLVYHTLDGSFTAIGSLKEVEPELGQKQFFRCNRCYIVNLEHVDGIRGDDVIVGGIPVQISRARKKVFLEAMNTYFGEVGK